MSVEEIVAALQAIVAEATGGADPDPNVSASLTEDQAARYEALEKQLIVARKSEEIMKRNAAYATVSTPIINGTVGVRNDEASRAFDHLLRTGRVDSGLISRAGQNEASGPAGGYFVPDTFRDKLIERQKAFGGLFNAAEKISTATGAPLVWMTNDDVLSNEAGIIAEGAANTFGADFVFGRNTFNAYKYDTAGASTFSPDSSKWLKVSWELLQDSTYDIQSFIARKFAERIQRKLAVDLINGSGVNEPVGIISTMGALSNSGVTIASATAPTYGELNTIIHSLDPAYRSGASWLMNDTTYAAMQGIVDTAGRPLFWNSNQSMTDGSSLTLLGYPVVIDQAMPTLTTGSVKGLVFGDLSQVYAVRQVKDFTLVTANELFAGSGQVGYLGWARYDGLVQDPNAGVYVTSHA